MTAEYEGFVPYLFYDDAGAAMDWYAEVFGFEDIGRWPGADGRVQNGEMRVGGSELWLDGGGRRADEDPRPSWVGIWVNDLVDLQARLEAVGLPVDGPVDREFGVRMLNVADPFGYLWGFMQRLPDAVG